MKENFTFQQKTKLLTKLFSEWFIQLSKYK